MAGSETAVIIVDSSSFDFAFEGDWKNIVGWENLWRFPYKNATRDSRDRLGNFTLSFEGYDVTFVGGGPMVPLSTYPPSTLTINPGTADSQTIPVVGSDDPPSFLPWYKTPLLPYGSHRVRVTHCVQVAINYALVTIGPDTPLAGRTIFVDDSDPQIQYAGTGWERNNDPTVGFRVNIAMPAQNTSIETTQAGDSFSFTFLGTSITAFGLYSWTNVSSLVLQYELDGNTTSESYVIQASDPIYRGKEPMHINVPFISYKDLSPTRHQLKVTVMEISNTTFRFDYLTYTPSFSSFASLSTPGNTVFTPTPEPDHESLQVKVVVGSVIGGLALLAISVGALVWWNRRLNARTNISSRGASQDVAAVQGAQISSSINVLSSRSAELSPPSSISVETNIPTRYPPEKVSRLASPSSQTSFPYLGALQPTTISPYPAEKLPIMPSNSSLASNSPMSTSNRLPAVPIARSRVFDSSSTNISTWGSDSAYADSATDSSVLLADTTAVAGHHDDQKLVTIHETPAEPPSYTTALSGLPPVD